MAKTITVSAKTNITLHPKARDAYDWAMDYPLFIEASRLPKNLHLAIAQQPIFCVSQTHSDNEETGKDESLLEMFSPIWLPRFWQNNQPPIGTKLVVLTNNEITDESIEMSAWGSAFSMLALSVDPKKITNLRNQTKQFLRPKLTKALLGSSSLSDTMLSRITGISRGTLVQQRQRKTASCTDTPELESETDLLAKLQKNWSPNEE